MQLIAATVALLAVSALELPSTNGVSVQKRVVRNVAKAIVKFNELTGGKTFHINAHCAGSEKPLKFNQPSGLYVKHPDIAAVEDYIYSLPEDERDEKINNPYYQHMLQLQYQWEATVAFGEISPDSAVASIKARDEEMAELRDSCKDRSQKLQSNAAAKLCRNESIRRNRAIIEGVENEMADAPVCDRSKAVEPYQNRIAELSEIEDSSIDPKAMAMRNRASSAYKALKNFVIHSRRATMLAACASIIPSQVIQHFVPEFQDIQQCKTDARAELARYLSEEEVAHIQKLALTVEDDFHHVLSTDQARVKKYRMEWPRKLGNGLTLKISGFSMDERNLIADATNMAVAIAAKAVADLEAKGTALPAFQKYFPDRCVADVKQLLKLVATSTNPIKVLPLSKFKQSTGSDGASHRHTRTIHLNPEIITRPMYGRLAPHILHEMTHHYGTHDFAYHSEACQRLATNDAKNAPPEKNADSYSNFARDNWNDQYSGSAKSRASGDDGDADSPTRRMESYAHRLEEIRKREYPQLTDCAYLDHAGATIPAQSFLASLHAAWSNAGVLGNPHSAHTPARTTAALIQPIKRRILDHFDAGDAYDVVFCMNATAAIKLVGEMVPWSGSRAETSADLNVSESILVRVWQWLTCWWNGLVALFRRRRAQSELWLLDDNHTSIVGLRALALKAGASVNLFSAEAMQRRFEVASVLESAQTTKAIGGPLVHLLALPAQSNFNGQRYPFEWIRKYQNRSNENERYLVLLDTASYCASARLSLQDAPADFVIVSFYKLFGLPTNLGALLVRKSVADIARKEYFGGGTVAALTATRPWQVFKKALSERYQDGSVPYFELLAVDCGFNYVEKTFGSWDAISAHTLAIAQYAYEAMREYRHYNGCRVVEFYPPDRKNQGPILNFNLVRSDGRYWPCAEVDRIADLNKVYLRSGGFCNAGARQRHLNLSASDIQSLFYKEGSACGTETDASDRPFGSVRISVGAMTTRQDIDRWLFVLKEHFTESSPAKSPAVHDTTGCVSICAAYVYPIKSCGAMDVTASGWPITTNGFQHDREWMIVDRESGKALSQKRYPKMCLIRPIIDLDSKELTITAPDMPTLVIPLAQQPDGIRSVKACGKSVDVGVYDANVSDWFTSFLGLQCDLARRIQGQTDSFANEGPMLVTSESSLADLNAAMEGEADMASFRPNLVLTGGAPFAEDEWTSLSIAGLDFDFKMLEKCRRCTMVNVQQDSGAVQRGTYLALSKTRRPNGGPIYFGRHAQPLIKTDEIFEFNVEKHNKVQIM